MRSIGAAWREEWKDGRDKLSDLVLLAFSGGRRRSKGPVRQGKEEGSESYDRPSDYYLRCDTVGRISRWQ